MGVEPVEDRSVCGWDPERGGGVVNGSAGRAGEEEAPVGFRLRQHRAEVTLPDREVLRERVGERHVALVPVAHRDRPAGAHEAVVAAAVVGDVAGIPGLGGLAAQLAGRARSLGWDATAGPPGVGVRDPAMAHGQSVERRAARYLCRDHPEQVVERMVLHHQHDDVLDLVKARRPRAEVGEREAVRAAHARRRRRRPGPRGETADGERGGSAGGAAQQRAPGDHGVRGGWAAHVGDTIGRCGSPVETDEGARSLAPPDSVVPHAPLAAVGDRDRRGGGDRGRARSHSRGGRRGGSADRRAHRLDDQLDVPDERASNRDRAREEEAREYFDRHGRWPEVSDGPMRRSR